VPPIALDEQPGAKHCCVCERAVAVAQGALCDTNVRSSAKRLRILTFAWHFTGVALSPFDAPWKAQLTSRLSLERS
jgi:hypothetical protein